MNKDFTEFQKWFKHYQKLFGLTGYKHYFKYESLDGCFADITVDLTNMVATIRLNTQITGKHTPPRNIKDMAKHEAIHLLVSRLEENGRSRYATSAEIYESTEELVYKLENLIP